MKFIRGLIFTFIFVLLIFTSVKLSASTIDIIKKEHIKFYSVNENIPIGELLDLKSMNGKKLIRVTVNYDTIRSTLKGEWLLNGNPLGIVNLEKGLNKSVTMKFDKILPANLKFRFIGREGQIRTRFITAKMERIKFKPIAPIIDIIKKDHLKFYEIDEKIPIGALLDLKSITGRKLIHATIKYNMVKSELKGEWILNGKSLEIVNLNKGMDQSVSRQFDQILPVNLKFRFIGRRGQIQTSSISAKMERMMAKPVIPIIKKKKLRKLSQLHRILPQVRSFEVISPTTGDTIMMGSEHKLIWQMTGMERKVFAELWRGNKKIKTIFEDEHGAKGKYNWRVSGKFIVPGGNYRIKLKTVDKRFNTESELFSITQIMSNLDIKKYIDFKRRPGFNTPDVRDPVSIRITDPGYNTKWEIFREYPIRWESRGLGSNEKIAIALKNSRTSMDKIIAVTDNTGIYNYTVPYPVGLFGDDLKVLITPLKYRGVEVTSPKFLINSPKIDLLCSSPRIEIEMKRKRRKLKWWEKLGDIFSGGFTYYVKRTISFDEIKHAVLHLKFDLVNHGKENLRNVDVSWAIITRQGYPVYESGLITVPNIYSKVKYAQDFDLDLSRVKLDSKNYIIEIWIDPFKDQNESERLRKNNRVAVDFRVREI